MTPAMITLALTILEEVVKETPVLVTDLQALFSKGTPTAEDFAALKARIQANDYKTLVTNTKLES